jgi:hypothetical protein
LGGKRDDIGSFVIQNRQGDYILAGITSSFGSGSEDVWLVKMALGQEEDGSAKMANLTQSLRSRASPSRSF